MRVADALADWFAAAGLTHYFGYAGGAIWPIMDGLIDHPEIKGIQAKHESHAVHQADVYFRESGRIAPVIVTKGPGLMNAVGGIASAMHDSIPMLVIAGGTPTHFKGKAGMQEMYYRGHEDALSVLRPITKGAWMIVRPDTAIEVLNQAMRTALSGRPGPVFVQFPTDIQSSEVIGEIEPPSARSVRTGSRANSKDVDEVVALLKGAKNPVLLIGGGLSRSEGGAEKVLAFVERFGIPAASTLTAKGILSENHELALGPVGRSGTVAAAEATREADVLIALGARFSDNNAGNWREGAIYDVPRTKIVQVDISADEIARNYPVEIGLTSDAGQFLEDLTAALGDAELDIAPWREKVAGFKAAWEEEILEVTHGETARIHPGRLSYELGEAIRKQPNAHVFIDIGDIVQYAEPYMKIHNPGSWHISPGMAEMGWASQGAPGAAVAKP